MFASSYSLLIRCNLAAVRQEIHLSGCSNFPSNLFASYDDIVAHCCEAWNKLIDQPWRIISIKMRD